MKLLALDYGAKKIGIAIGDTIVGVAQVRDFLINDKNIFEKLAEFRKKEKIERVILGLPRGFSQATQQTLEVYEFSSALQKQIPPRVELLDERFTTKIAAQNLHAAGKNSKKQKVLIDSESARILLQDYLDRMS
jgi:putative Holliday junction resolvase